MSSKAPVEARDRVKLALSNPVTIPVLAKDGTVVAAALVDPEDFDAMNAHTWRRHSRGYACRGRSINGRFRVILLHREIMHPPPGLEVDHLNGDKLDNRRANMRLVTHAQNAQNRSKFGGRYSQHRGVCFDKRSGRWVAGVKLNGVRHNLGYFDTEVAAADAALEGRKRLLPYAHE